MKQKIGTLKKTLFGSKKIYSCDKNPRLINLTAGFAFTSLKETSC